MTPTNENIYLDSNFLVSYLVPNHDHSTGAGQMMSDLISNNNTLFYSPLTFSETLHGIVSEEKKQNPALTSPQVRQSDFYEDLKQFADILLAFPQTKLAQFTNPMQACSNSLEYIRDFNMKSADAFHVAYALDLGIKYIVTNDGKFNQITSLNLVKVDFCLDSQTTN